MLLIILNVDDDIILKIDDDVIQNGHRACADHEAKERHILLKVSHFHILSWWKETKEMELFDFFSLIKLLQLCVTKYCLNFSRRTTFRRSASLGHSLISIGAFACKSCAVD